MREKEMQRLQAVMRKQLEKEKRRQDMILIKAEENRKKTWEAEKRQQDIKLIKAEENCKKAEEKERVKQEKTEEKRLNKERSLQLKRLALAKAKALKKPNKDMCLADLKVFTHRESVHQMLSQIPGLQRHNSKDAFDVVKLEKNQVREKTVASWCVEEQAMEVDIHQLQQVEALERRVVSAGLQIKGWMHPEPESEREDLVYQEDNAVRRPNNPLDIAVMRLAELERGIDRSSEEEVTPGMRLWHQALGEVRSSAQLSLCIQQLQKFIDWDRPVMKVHCHRCQEGDNEELLLLCHGCDKGCHTYCHRPKITTVPEGKWFCYICVAKENAELLRSRKLQNRALGGGKRGKDKLDSGGSCAKKAKLAKDERYWLEMCRVLLA
ncbi:bromodomain adjacent to zinc finger domain protein 2B [Pleuronectes platessa]|uniref:bromodomain adjacent to zinc finger domain protein 2B n=1 Tax=Pleuronectes platessa TaxID=8262 RepID=UPI00232A39EB|nr:bromodomain adjacent to zinc finger domain protein 2B [Pleuronectes platessa]